MELFLIYIWLKLPTIILVSGCLFGLGLLAFIFSKVAHNESSSRAISFSKWLDTEEAKNAGAEIKYYYTAEKLYKERVPLVTTKTPVLPLPKWFVAPLVFCGFLSFALPDQTEAAILVGSAIALEVAKSPEGAKVGQLIRGKANELLDAELKKLQPQPAK